MTDASTLRGPFSFARIRGLMAQLQGVPAAEGILEAVTPRQHRLMLKAISGLRGL